MLATQKSYGKINEAEQMKLEARRRSRKRIAIISLSSIVLVGTVVAAVVGTAASRKDSKNGEVDRPLASSSVKAICDVTLYKDSCYDSLGPKAGNSLQIKPEDIFKLSIQVALEELTKVSEYFSNNKEAILNGTTEKRTVAALQSCNELLDLALDHLNDSLPSGGTSVLDAAEDLRTWLSSALTCHHTCIDGFEDNGAIKGKVQNLLQSSSELTSNSLAIITWISNVVRSIKLRRLMSFPGDPPHHHRHDNDKFPKWVHSDDRKLLQSADFRKMADAVVAKDGSSKYKTIKAALAAVPKKSNQRFIIYVKKGVYNENVRVEKTMWNVVMVGDGRDATLVSGSLNAVDGTPTFQSATFAVFGKGFIARDMGFLNTAGPAKHQAVALMSNADQSIFYRCRIDAFQDSLYTHANRQFYRECNIYGTVDFIFGNSAVVIQNSNILPKQPMTGQQNTITAQGKVDRNQNTGISIHNCNITPAQKLTNVKTYLGRPWKDYSTTIFMRCYMGSLIDPAGWLPWTGNTAPSTISYAEFMNSGLGSSIKKRVKWKGLRFINWKEASKFTVKSFINGEKWINGADITFNSNL